METPTERSCFVVVSGPAASGKTTLARGLADVLGVALLAKDTIKDPLFTAFNVRDTQAAELAGRAALAVLLALAREVRGWVVLESVWPRAQSVGELSRLDGRLVEVFCRCDLSIAKARYAARTAGRPAAYVSEHRDPAELWTSETTEPVAGGWPVIEVDTNTAVDVAALAALIRETLPNDVARNQSSGTSRSCSRSANRTEMPATARVVPEVEMRGIARSRRLVRLRRAAAARVL